MALGRCSSGLRLFFLVAQALLIYERQRVGAALPCCICSSASSLATIRMHRPVSNLDSPANVHRELVLVVPVFKDAVTIKLPQLALHGEGHATTHEINGRRRPEARRALFQVRHEED